MVDGGAEFDVAYHTVVTHFGDNGLGSGTEPVGERVRGVLRGVLRKIGKWDSVCVGEVGNERV